MDPDDFALFLDGLPKDATSEEEIKSFIDARKGTLCTACLRKSTGGRASVRKSSWPLWWQETVRNR